jgi:hypothetical protein
MSYHLAVWEGPQPTTDAEAAETFEALYAQHTDADHSPQPTLAMRRYVAALLARYPHLDDDNEDDTPWSDAPLVNNATGPIFYFGMVFSHAETASAFAANVAKEHGLVCLDPQSNKLR